MNKVLILGFISLVLFLLSASASWYLRAVKMPQSGESATADKTHATAADAARRNQDGAPAIVALPAAEIEKSAARPPYVAGTEQALNLATNLRERLGAVRDKEAQLDARQKRLELIYQDIRGERGAIDELRKQVSNELKAVEGKMAAVERQRSESEQKIQEKSAQVSDMEKRRLELVTLEQTNIKKMAEMYDNMDAESAARILQQLADTAKLDTAVKVLGLMKERQAAKVLAAMPPDSGLAAQLLEKLKGFDRAPAQASK